MLILADNSEVNVLNEVGSRIFELADGGRTVAGIAAIIAAEYDVSAERAAADTAEFVSLLVRHDVLVLTEGGD